MAVAPESSSPWLKHSKAHVLSMLYTAISCLSTAAVGAGLLYYCSDSLSNDSQLVSSTVKISCLVTGLVLLVFVAVWGCFSLLMWQTSKSFVINRNVQPSSKSHQAKQFQSSRPSPVPCYLSLLGMLSLILILLSVVLEMSLTGLLWWTSHQMGLQYQVRDICFCTVGQQSSARLEDVLQLDCPQFDDLSCPAVYQAVPVQMSGGLVMSTRQCQLIDGSGLHSDCLHFLRFWSWFKVWRIVLPLVVVIKLPLLVFYCCSWISAIGRKKVQEQQQVSSHVGQHNNATSSVSLDSHLLNPPPQLQDPVKFYGNICANVDYKLAYEKRETTIEQAHVQEMTALASKPATLRSTATMARYISNIHAPAPCSPPPLTVVSCPVPPPLMNNKDSQAGLTQDYSLPDIEEHIISTPIESDKFVMTPQFDLSKVVKPGFNLTTNEDNPAPYYTYHQLGSQPSRQTRLPSFSSSMLEMQQNHNKAPNQFDFELNKFPQYIDQDHNCCPGFIPPPPPLRKSSVGTLHTYPAPPCLLPPPKPTRTSSISSSTTLHAPIRLGSTSGKMQYSSTKPPPPPPPIRQISSPIVQYTSSQVQVVVDNASDYDSSTCGSTHSTTPIVRPTRSSNKTGKVWATSPAPPRLQLSSTSVVGSGMHYSDIQEISRKARNISTSSNVDWSKLP